MKGPFDLKTENTESAPAKPGAYMLGKGGKKIYVGRADEKLREKLAGHLPEKEVNRLLQNYKSDQFWYEEAESALEAYQIEFRWYVRFTPAANFLAPAPPSEKR